MWITLLRRGLAAPLLFLLVAGTASAAPPPADGSDAILPGHEAAIMALLGPGPVEEFRCGDWQLEDMRVGPDCAVRVQFRSDGVAGPLTATLTPRDGRDGPGSASILVAVAPSAGGAGALAGCLAGVLGETDPGDFFAGRCDRKKRAAATAPTEATPAAWLRLFLCLAAILGALALLRRRDPIAPATPRLDVPARWVLGALIAVALALRLRVMQVAALGPYELEHFGFGGPSQDLLWQLGLSGGQLCRLGPCFHPPGLRAVLDLWLALGDALGVGGELVWLRLPNLALTAWLLWLLVRVGRTVGAPAAGWAAALLAAFLPRMVELGVHQGPYFAELVVSVWFLERLAACVVGRAAVHRSLAVAGAAALWTGHMSALVVGPGALLYLVVVLRRGERRSALAALLLLAGLYGPIAAHALDAVTSYATLSVATMPDAATSLSTEAIYGHIPLAVADPTLGGFLAFPLRAARHLVGPVGDGAALLGIALLVVRRARVAWFAVLLLAVFAAAYIAVSTRWVNLSPLFPLLLFLPAWGFAALPPAREPPWVRAAMVSVFAVVAFASAVAHGLGAWAVTGQTSAGGVARWLLQGADAHTVTAPIRAPGGRGVPVLLLVPALDRHYLACAERSDAAAVRACWNARGEARFDPETGLLHYALHGRPVAAFPPTSGERDARPPTCPRLDALARRPDWAGRRSFAVVGLHFENVMPPACVQELEGRGCRELRSMEGLRLLDCPAP